MSRWRVTYQRIVTDELDGGPSGGSTVVEAADPPDAAAKVARNGIQVTLVEPESVTLAGELDNPPTGYPGAIRLVGDDIVKPWRYKGP